MSPPTEWQRIYDELSDEGAPHVTKITGQLDKSKPLMYWAAGLSFDYVKEKFFDPMSEALKTDPDRAIQLMKEFYSDFPYHYKKAKSYHEKKSKEARDIGSYVHEAAEDIFRALIEESELGVPVDDDIQKPVEALLNWFADNDVRPVLVEQKVFGSIMASDFGDDTPEIFYIGKLDVVSFVNKRLLTIDLKAAKGIYDDFPIQVAAYDYALNQMIEQGHLEGDETEGTAILRLDKETGMPEFVEYSREQTDEYFQCFAHLCAYVHMDRRRRENDKFRKAEAKKKPEKEEDPY